MKMVFTTLTQKSFQIAGAEKERKTLDAVANARQKISREITELKERLKASKDAIQHFQKEIQRVEKEQEDESKTPSVRGTAAP